jgi:hypothetical protein
MVRYFNINLASALLGIHVHSNTLSLNFFGLILFYSNAFFLDLLLLPLPMIESLILKRSKQRLNERKKIHLYQNCLKNHLIEYTRG